MENATSFEWWAVSSEAALAVFAALTFLLCAALPARMSKAVSCFAMVGIAAALAVEIFSSAPALSFCGMLGGKSTYGVFALACALLTSLMAFGYFRKGARGGN